MNKLIEVKSVFHTIRMIDGVFNYPENAMAWKFDMMGKYFELLEHQISSSKIFPKKMKAELLSFVNEIKFCTADNRSPFVKEDMDIPNDVLILITQKLANFAQLKYISPHYEVWLEEYAFTVLATGSRDNPAVHQSALYWCRKYASDGLKMIIIGAYRYAEEGHVDFDVAFNETVADYNEKEAA